MRDIDNSKAAGVNRLSGRFLKDGADVLANPVTDICNFSTSLHYLCIDFQELSNEKKAEKLMSQITDLSP